MPQFSLGHLFIITQPEEVRGEAPWYLIFYFRVILNTFWFPKLVDRGRKIQDPYRYDYGTKMYGSRPTTSEEEEAYFHIVNRKKHQHKT
jgi:hypothetical protein